jgi:PAS domain S-box-containing protein
MDDIDTLKKEIKALKSKNAILTQSLKQTYSLSNRVEDSNAKLVELKNSILQKEHYIKAVVESNKHAIVVIDKEYKIKTFNQASESMFLYKKDAIIEKATLEKIIPKRFFNIYKKALSRYFEEDIVDTNLERSIKLKGIKSNGEKFSIRVSLGLNRDIKNKLVVANIEDITEEIKRNKSIKQKDRLLVQQSKMAAMGEMIGAIAHQWRQPLNITALMIQGLQEQFLDEDLDEESLEYIVDKCMQQINFMSNTIEDFRNFFKPNRSKVNFSVKELLEKSISMVESQFKSHNITLSLDGDDFRLTGYDTEFQQVILNILSNSKDAIIDIQKNDSGYIGKISIEVYKNYIKISDNGGGIPDEIKDRVFEPYFTTKDDTSGTGIGLYMSKTIIEDSMNGKIYLSNSDNGSVFKIEFL